MADDEALKAARAPRMNIPPVSMWAAKAGMADGPCASRVSFLGGGSRDFGSHGLSAMERTVRI